MSCPCECGCEQRIECMRDEPHTHREDMCHCVVLDCPCNDDEISAMVGGAEKALVAEGKLTPPGKDTTDTPERHSDGLV
jgi:hypothetical protein